MSRKGHSALISIIRYPNGRLVHFTYGSGGSHADNLNRLDAIKADSGGSPGATLASYSYLGAGTVVKIDYEERQLGAAAQEELGLDGPQPEGQVSALALEGNCVGTAPSSAIEDTF